MVFKVHTVSFHLRTVFIELQKPSGDGEIRTLDPLLARQVLSQLSYTPILMVCAVTIPELLSSILTFFKINGLKWTRTTDLTLIRRAL